MSAAATSRVPPAPATVSEPSQARNTVGRSEAGSPWTSEPPMVPRLRTCWSAMSAVAWPTGPSSALPCMSA